MIDKKFYIIAVILTLATILTFAYSSFAQRPPNGGGRGPEWIISVDVNKNGRIEQEEFRAAADAFFKKFDRNGNNILEGGELPGKPDENRRDPEGNRPPPQEVPPFLFLERGEMNLTREEFDEKANLRFIVVDANGDGAIDREEIKALRPPDKQPFQNMGMAQFVGAEMRFGDKVVKKSPFSAETIREESKRLFDGNLIKNQSKGLVYRDGEGRVRQEQPFEKIGGFPVTGTDNQPIKLVQIIDFAAGNSFSLNTATKTYSKIPYLQSAPLTTREEENAKKESLGKQTIEGIVTEGTRTTIELPAGQIGNDKPIFVVTERWFSPELQMVILSKHTDPFIGEVTFRLVNIKLGEPSSELFKVPNDYKFFDIEKNRRRVNE
jgi:hypothetical protein